MSAVIETTEVTDPCGAGGALLQQAVAQSATLITRHATLRHATHAQLVRSPRNARRKPRDVRELKALLRSQGLLQNLVCYEERRDDVPTGLLAVAAGDSRWQALGELIAEGDLPADYDIPCLMVTEAEAVMVSLAENLGREPMHAADVFDGMRLLAAEGRSVAEIALAFGVEQIAVRRQLKLANVAPRLFALFRADQASYEQMAALAVSDDHAAQQQVWDSLPQWNRPPGQIRRLLTAQQLNVRTDRVARLVGVKAYEAAGGVVERDLFSSDGDGYLADVALLESLARARLERVARKLAAERWSWIEVRVHIEAAELACYARARTVALEPDAAQAAALGEGGDQPAQAAIERERAAIGRIDPADLALAGALVTIAEDGKPCVLRGLMRPQDRPVSVAGTAADQAGSKRGKSKAAHSARLTALLGAQRTLALRAEMVNQPGQALLLLAQRLLHSVFYSRQRCAEVLQLDLRAPDLPAEAQTGPAWERLAAQHVALAALLPEHDTDGALLDWLQAQPQALVLDCLAYCSACMLNASQDGGKPVPAIDQSSRLLALDMRRWWQPSAANYFAHLNKTRIAEVVAQAVSPAAAVPLERLGKQAAVEAAARAVADSGWLPALFRVAPAAHGQAEPAAGDPSVQGA
ncbi:ParB/RepB/Spo0J family partition protein [Duganella sp. BJB1802]|uniref:ParB/RepB/Spo0J family partition protein n=1 Tax=Duganella sp. BJB1802 TaxID=2744575 RepID=UPI0015942EDA|nr:ParB/RepB/Spo0J family partition protein [Duganella sp. BJB1802]NVD69573.1 ParB/RepB/Spo0J family partition protein [Duganella sp. BJB1802]